jgi:hypothetical protein
MNGISIITDTNGNRSAIIDLNTLRKESASGQEVVQYLTSLEDIEDIIDVELSRSEPSYAWEEVKQELKNAKKLDANV